MRLRDDARVSRGGRGRATLSPTSRVMIAILAILQTPGGLLRPQDVFESRNEELATVDLESIGVRREIVESSVPAARKMRSRRPPRVMRFQRSARGSVRALTSNGSHSGIASVKTLASNARIAVARRSRFSLSRAGVMSASYSGVHDTLSADAHVPASATLVAAGALLGSFAKSHRLTRRPIPRGRARYRCAAQRARAGSS